MDLFSLSTTFILKVTSVFFTSDALSFDELASSGYSTGSGIFVGDGAGSLC